MWHSCSPSSSATEIEARFIPDRIRADHDRTNKPSRSRMRYVDRILITRQVSLSGMPDLTAQALG
jgi:hypothetical protein